MINYNKLFDLLYSDRISEGVKTAVIDRAISGNYISEGFNGPSPYVSFLNTLVESNISEACLYDVIDVAFGNLSEEVINEVSDEWKRAKATEYINRRAGELGKMVRPNNVDNSPVGLAGVKRNKLMGEIERGHKFLKANKPQAINTPSNVNKSSVLDKLKSAVGKVKSWTEKWKTNPIGLGKVGNSQAPKAASKTAAKKPEQLKLDSSSKSETETKTKSKPEPEKIERPAETQSKVETETKGNSQRGVFTPVELGTKKGEEAPAASPAPKKTRKPKTDAKSSTKVDAEKAPAGGKKKTDSKKKTDGKKSNGKKSKIKTDKASMDAAAAVAAQAANKEGEVLVPAGKSGGKSRRQAALKEACLLLLDTNISESAFVEILELMSNKQIADKAIERDKQEFDNALDALNHVEEVKARTGHSPVSDETYQKMVANAEAKGTKLERFRAHAERKFG